MASLIADGSSSGLGGFEFAAGKLELTLPRQFAAVGQAGFDQQFLGTGVDRVDGQQPVGVTGRLFEGPPFGCGLDHLEQHLGIVREEFLCPVDQSVLSCGIRMPGDFEEAAPGFLVPGIVFKAGFQFPQNIRETEKFPAALHEFRLVAQDKCPGEGRRIGFVGQFEKGIPHLHGGDRFVVEFGRQGDQPRHLKMRNL